MKIYQELYVSEELEKRRDDVIQKLKEDKIQWNIYLIVLVGHNNSQLEIVNSTLLVHKLFPREGIIIVGIAKGKSQAMELIKEIVSSIYAKTGKVDIRKFILGDSRI